MKQILVPVDFSFYATKAVDAAVYYAKASGASLTLLYIWDGGSSDPGDYLAIGNTVKDETYDDAEGKLRALAVSIEETEKIVVQQLIKTGAVEQLITDTAAAIHADLIVMGTVGASGIKEKLWGSKTASVLSRSLIPVLVIPWDYTVTSPKHFMLAVNHFDTGKEAREKFFHIASIFTAPVDVVVFSDEDDADAILYMENERNITSFAEQMRKQYPGLTINARHLSGKTFEDTLQAYIRDEGVDVLAMITHHRNFWDRIFNSAITRKMSFHTTVPLLALPVADNP